MISDNGKKKKKNNTKLMIISVLVLTILTMNVSYSAFFDVKSQTTLYEFTAGTLSVTVNTSEAITGEMKPYKTSDLPSATKNGEIASGFTLLTLNNEGNLDADYVVTISQNVPAQASATDLISMEYLNLGVYDYTNKKWVQFGQNYYTPISNLTESSTGIYPIIRDVLTTTGASKQYRIYVWLNEKTPITEIGKLVNLKVNVRSTTTEGKQDDNGQSSVKLKG